MRAVEFYDIILKNVSISPQTWIQYIDRSGQEVLVFKFQLHTFISHSPKWSTDRI